MTLTTPYSATFIVGDGETKTFSYLFEEVSPNFISVMVYNSLTGLISTPTYIIDTDQKQVIFGEDTPAPTADETVCIYRNTPNVQDVAFRTLHGYDAQTLENILSKIVAMIQEIKSNYFSTQVLQGDPWQLDLLSSADDGATVNIDYTAKKLVKGLYFRITSGNLQVSADGVTYLTLPKSDDVAEFRQYEQTLPDLTVIRKLQYRVGNQWFDAEANAQYTADEAYALAESVQTTMSAHINNTQNPHQTSMANLTDTDLSDAESGQFLQFDGVKWKAVYSTASVSWGGILGDIDDQTDLQDKLYTKFDKTGGTVLGEIDIRRNSSTSSALLTMTNNTANTARIWRFAPSYSTVSLSVYPGSTETNGYRFVSTGFCPASNNARYLGAASLKWKGVYTGVLNNGADLVVPNKAGTLATMADVELAARSGTQLTDQGVWYAKMYAATVAPAAENGTNYADFSQVDGQGNPIIVTYNRVNGAWVQDQTITPPAEYDGYVLVTSKIWDIAEQAGQQGGRILWNHTSKEFTPYPQIISFEDINVTGNSTVVMPQNPGANQIVNKDYVDNHIPTGNFYHPDLFDWKWADHQVNDVQWLRADTFSWQAGSVYESAYQHLADDIDGFSSSIDILIPAQGESLTFVRYEDGDITGYYAWKNNDSIAYTNTLSLSVGDDAYLSLSPVKTGEITSVNNSLQSETIGGVTVQFYLADDGHKICPASEESNVAAIYAATGVAWYYIIDTVNERFKLPRTKFGVTGLRDTVGNYVAPGLPDHNHSITTYNSLYPWAGNSGSTWQGTKAATTGNASSSNPIYGNSDTVQPPATQMYLYFYVGEFTQPAIENTAGLNAELFNDKVDVGHEVIEFQAPSSTNNYTWYRKYADGWVEQGGQFTATSVADGSGTAGNNIINLPITMANDRYWYSANIQVGGSGWEYANGVILNARSTTTLTLKALAGTGNVGLFWEVKGMAA